MKFLRIMVCPRSSNGFSCRASAAGFGVLISASSIADLSVELSLFRSRFGIDDPDQRRFPSAGTLRPLCPAAIEAHAAVAIDSDQSPFSRERQFPRRATTYNLTHEPKFRAGCNSGWRQPGDCGAVHVHRDRA
jgi:hypothetical protein